MQVHAPLSTATYNRTSWNTLARAAASAHEGQHHLQSTPTTAHGRLGAHTVMVWTAMLARGGPANLSMHKPLACMAITFANSGVRCIASKHTLCTSG